MHLDKFSIGYPPPDLAHCIDSCWSLANANDGGTDFYEIFPDSCIKLIFRYSPTAFRMVLMGPITEKTTIEIDTSANYMGLRFLLGQTPSIADVNSAELVDSFVEMTSFQGQSLESLAQQLLLQPLHQAKQAIMEELIRGCTSLLDNRCRLATSIIAANDGQLRITTVADKLGIHIRSLERLFATQIGLSPKKLTRLVRLRHVFSLIFAGEYENLAALAYTCGYSDQSHMIKEFKEMTGRLPSEDGACEPRLVAGVPKTRIIHRYRP